MENPNTEEREKHEDTSHQDAPKEPEGSTNSTTPPDSSSVPTHDTKTVMAVLSYLGPLVIIPFLTHKEDPFVKFHIKQGLVLFAMSVVLWFFGSMFFMLWPLMQLLHLAILILIVIGIINASKGNQKELPLVGSLGHHFKI